MFTASVFWRRLVGKQRSGNRIVDATACLVRGQCFLQRPHEQITFRSVAEDTFRQQKQRRRSMQT
jgi:hypothetical protein